MSLVDRVDIVLVEPSEGGNVGSCARALKNMGFRRLTIVRPQYDDPKNAIKMAVHAADLVEQAQIHQSMEDAIQSAAWVVGLSCRPRSHSDRKPPMAPEEFIAKLKQTPADSKVALVFGAERTGLTNAQLGLCQDIFTFPTCEEYPSMNLAQSVMLAAWEIRKADLAAPIEQAGREQVTAGELEGLISHLERTLEIIGYLNPQNPEHILRDLRKVLSRAKLDPRELSMLRGIFHRMDVWIAMHGGPPTPNQPR
jgi:tRNA/rRNA methyltransferase